MEITQENSKFKAGVRYRWNPSDNFNVTGAELNILYNYLSEIMKADNIANVVNVLRIADCFGVAQRILEAGIEAGSIKEINEKQEETNV